MGLRALLRRRRWEREMDAEFRFHLKSLADDYVSRGMARSEAEARAAREFGAIALAKDECRDARRITILDDAVQDVRYAVRSCRRNPGFTLVAVLTLGLGIAANAGLFSVVNAVLLKPLRFPAADRLVSIWENVPPNETPLGRPLRQPVPVADLRELRRTLRTITDVDAYGTLVELRLGRNEDVDVSGARVSATTLRALAATVRAGRLYDARESDAMDQVLVLSARAWRRHFSSDPGIVGKAVTVEGTYPPPYGLPRQRFTVIGVMADQFAFPDDHTDFWIPLSLDRSGGSGNIARLAHGVSRAAAEVEVNAVLSARRRPVSQTNTAASPHRFQVVGLQDELVSTVRPILSVLMVAAALVLLIVCGNVANLLLARANVREREVSLRIAIGAGRGRIVRQMITEGLVLSVFGGIAGTFMAFAGVGILKRLFESLHAHTNIRQVGLDVTRVAAFPRVDEIGIDLRTLTFTAAICLVTGVFFGLAPALRTFAASLAGALREGSASALSGFGLFRRNATRSALVVAQVALAVALLIAGGLVGRSFLRLITADLGFRPANILTFQLRTPKGYSNRDVRRLSDQLIERLAALPGVQGAAYGRLPLVSFLAYAPFQLSPSERLPSPPMTQPGGGSFYTAQYPELRLVSREYVRVMGMRILTGHDFSDPRHTGERHELIINATLAHQRFAGQDPVGREVYLGSNPWRVIGVVGDVRQQGPDVNPSPQVFLDLSQLDSYIEIEDDPAYYEVRTIEGSNSALLANIRRVVEELDRQTMLDNVATMDELVDSALARPRLYATLLGSVALLALVIAAVGVYGVMAYAVSQNTREIGVRMALGARQGEVLGLVIGRAAALTAIGMAIGLIGAAAVARYLQSLIFGLTPRDAPTYLGVALAFGAVALVAAYFPARRATLVNPLIALRAD